ncbi:hypothetical protein [Jannaschia sp. W003]|nr:hypothetical protein [Jannaschia sp. W003]UWQ22659.1 hypothetical protein K3554_06440 [Jannaschia sp. W003]
MNVCTLMSGPALTDMPVFWVALGLSLFVASLATRSEAGIADGEVPDPA